MKQLLTTGIILSRTDYGEADRILTLLTPDYGKLRLLARGVRKVKSKLAGGIELFSISHITFIQGRSDLGTLVSTRLDKHYGRIVQDVNRTMLGYDLIKLLNKVTEDQPESEYFELLQQAFEALDDAAINLDLVRAWFNTQLLRFAGHTPNLQTDEAGNKLSAESRYDFNFESGTFSAHPNGRFGADEIKFLRLLFNGNQPAVLSKITGALQLIPKTLQLVQLLVQQYIH